MNMHMQGSVGHLHNVACQPKTLNNNASLPLVWTPKLSHSNSLPGHEGSLCRGCAAPSASPACEGLLPLGLVSPLTGGLSAAI